MQIEENTTQESIAFGAYKEGIIEVQGKAYQTAVKLKNSSIEVIETKHCSMLQCDDLIPDKNDLPELIIIGTGSRQQFLHPRLAAELASYGVGFECMNTASACRTLTLLQTEKRNVWAWLWP